LSGSSQHAPEMRLNAPWMLIGLVLALAPAAACTGGGNDAEATVSIPGDTSTGERPAAPLSPSDFAADVEPFRVSLTWEPPPEQVERFVLFRNGRQLAIRPGSASSYTDRDVLPEQSYTYEIASQSGELVSDRIPVVVELPVPALRTARLAGTFDVNTRFVSKTGYGDYSHPNFGWRFVPRCDSGPCDVVWRDIHESRFHARLVRRAAGYKGTYTGKFTIECKGSRSSSVVDLALRVAAANMIGGEWLATRLEGTLEHSEAAQLGCRPGEAKLSVHGRLVK
jgi:hypothetical protein